MIFLDTNILLDLFRGYPPSIQWFISLPDDEELTISGLVAGEILCGCRNQKEMHNTYMDLHMKYDFYWPTIADNVRALYDFKEFHLILGIDLNDALIGETAKGLKVPIYTRNVKHMEIIPDLEVIKPYD